MKKVSAKGKLNSLFMTKDDVLIYNWNIKKEEVWYIYI